MIDFSAATSVLPLHSVFASGDVYAVETQGSFLAQPPVLGTIAVIASGLAYSGVWRGWARAPFLGLGRLTLPFGLGFFGVGLLLISLPIHLPQPADEILGNFELIIMFVGMVGGVWLPRFLLPRWFKEEHGLSRKHRNPADADGRSGADIIASRESELRARMLTLREHGPNAAVDGLRRAAETRSPGDTTLISGYLGGAIDADRVGALSADRGEEAGEILDRAFGRGPDAADPDAGRSGRHAG